MVNNVFNVLWVDPEGYSHWERYNVDAIEAMQAARSLTTRPAISKILIIDGDDFCVFLWEDGKLRLPHQFTDVGVYRRDH